MASETGLFTSATWQATGGGSLVTVNKNLLSFPELNFNPEEIPLATGLNLRLRDRDEITLRCHDISLFAALKTLMVARTELEFSLIGATTHQWDPMRFSVRYVFDQVPNIKTVWIAAEGTSTTPPDAAWTSLGSIQQADAPTIEVAGPNDGVGLPLYTATTLQWNLRLIDDAATAVLTTLASFAKQNCRIALESPDGTFLYLGASSAGNGVFLQRNSAPRFGVEEFSSGVDVQITGSQEDPDNLFVLPGTPPDYIYAFDLSLAAVSTDQSDYYSRT